MRCYNIELLAPKNGLSIHEIWVRIIHGYKLFSRMDRPFLGCVLCTGAHYTRKITVHVFVRYEFLCCKIQVVKVYYVGCKFDENNVYMLI